jgi:glycosyltransferase involved in cell wall biosynthesis
MGHPLRIFVDCHVFDGVYQGTRTYLKGLYAELIKDKSLHFLFAARDTGILEQEFGLHENVEFLRYQTGNKFRRLLTEMPRLIKAHKADLAHFQYRVPPIKHCKYLVTTHDALFEDYPEYFPVVSRWSHYLTFKYSAKKADVVFTVSEFSKDEIARHLGVPDAIVMPNGVDEVFYEPYDKQAIQALVNQRFGLEKYWIYISRREPRKGQHTLLREFVDLKLYESLQLVFVGHETYVNPEFDAILHSLDEKVRKRILILESLDFPTTLNLLRGASGMVYPSMAEGFGIPPLEAAAARIPVLCSNQTAMADFTFFGDELFNPRDGEEFRRKLVSFAQNPPSDEVLSHRAQAIRSQFNWEKAAQVFQQSIAGFR